MQLSEHFTLAEFTRSNTALRRGIRNTPTRQVVANLTALCSQMEAIRGVLGVPIRITSGYRCPKLNRAIGGARRSQHVVGEACDFQPIGMSIHEAFEKMHRYLPDSFDQAILEPNWIHVSYRPDKRRQWLRARRVAGRMRYYRYQPTA